ncbi:hypothetical protein HK098_006350 [Nowakowskiella sp. JEL0407]|nr:hypothetical protein HK098_006350 [Nowakowskiella sp. JEL0407]
MADNLNFSRRRFSSFSAASLKPSEISTRLKSPAINLIAKDIKKNSRFNPIPLHLQSSSSSSNASMNSSSSSSSSSLDSSAQQTPSDHDQKAQTPGDLEIKSKNQVNNNKILEYDLSATINTKKIQQKRTIPVSKKPNPTIQHPNPKPATTTDTKTQSKQITVTAVAIPNKIFQPEISVDLNSKEYVRNRIVIHKYVPPPPPPVEPQPQKITKKSTNSFVFPKPLSSAVITSPSTTQLNALQQKKSYSSPATAKPSSSYWRSYPSDRNVASPAGTLEGALESLQQLEPTRPKSNILQKIHPKLFHQAEKIYGEFATEIEKESSLEILKVSESTEISEHNRRNKPTLKHTGQSATAKQHQRIQKKPKKTLQTHPKKPLSKKLAFNNSISSISSSSSSLSSIPTQNQPLPSTSPSEPTKKSPNDSQTSLSPNISRQDSTADQSKPTVPTISINIDTQPNNHPRPQPPPPQIPPKLRRGSSILGVPTQASQILRQLTSSGVIDSDSPHPLPTTTTTKKKPKLRLSPSEIDLLISRTGQFSSSADTYTRFLLGARNLRVFMPGVGEIVWKTGKSRAMVANLNALAGQCLASGNFAAFGGVGDGGVGNNNDPGGGEGRRKKNGRRRVKSGKRKKRKDAISAGGGGGDGMGLVVGKPVAGGFNAGDYNVPKHVTILGDYLRKEDKSRRESKKRSGIGLSYLRVVNPSRYRRALKLEEMRKQLIKKIETLEELRI